MRKPAVFPLSLAVAFLLCSQAFAEENNNPIYAKLKVRYMPASDVENQTGDFTMAKIDFRIGYKGAWDNGRPFYINIGPDHYVIQDDTPTNLPSGTKSRGLRAGTEFDLPMVEDERFLLGLELNPTFQSAHDYAFARAAFRFKSSIMLKYKDSEDANAFQWVLGANFRPDYDFLVLPIFGFNYKVNDKVMVNLVSDSPNVSYALTEKTKLLAEFDYTMDEFEMTDSSEPNKGAILSIQDFAAGLGVRHEFNEHLKASLSAGGVFNRILKFQNGTGKVVPENSPYFSAKISAKF